MGFGAAAFITAMADHPPHAEGIASPTTLPQGLQFIVSFFSLTPGSHKLTYTDRCLIAILSTIIWNVYSMVNPGSCCAHPMPGISAPSTWIFTTSLPKEKLSHLGGAMVTVWSVEKPLKYIEISCIVLESVRLRVERHFSTVTS